MKKATEEEKIFEILLDIENNCVDAENSFDNVIYLVNEITKRNIEALKSELKEFNEKTFDETIKYHNIVRYRDYFEKVTKTYLNNLVEQVINN